MTSTFDCSDLPVPRSLREWGQVFTDVDTWTPAVLEICRRAHIPVRSIEAGYPGSNAVFVVNKHTPTVAVIKIYAPLWPEDYTLERVLHPILSRWPDIGAPQLLAEGTLGTDGAWPFIVLSYVPGEPIREIREDIPRCDLLAASRDLGHRLRVLHDIPIDHLGALDTRPEGWQRTAERYLTQTVEKLRARKALPKTVLERIPGFVHAVLQESAGLAMVLTSGDVTEDHVMLEERDGHWVLSGLIDFADALVAPRDYEWVALWFSALDRDDGCLRAFREGYGGDVTANAAFYRKALAF
ncbi:MAG: aminoglycoside phosphotransferase family protein, partial [Anaerolineae bacterium]|nr:aminoglycoside phosphotransferase family protein [Anaerolineae bacterium]